MRSFPRKTNVYLCPFPHDTLHLHCSSMTLNDVLHNRQAQPGTAFLGPVDSFILVKGFKYMLERFSTYSFP